MRALLFTVVVTILSKLIELHDRLRSGVDLNGPIVGRGLSRHSIASGRNVLDAVWCEPLFPGSEEGPKHAVLICHGIGETVAYWTRAQQILAERGVASLVFNYSGYGRSTGWISAKQCEMDAVAAMAWLRDHVGPECAVSLLGFSMGTGVAAAIANKVGASKLVLYAGFTSFREAAVSIGWPRWLAWMSPEIWDNRVALCNVTMPVLVVHGEHDELFPFEMAHAVAGACSAPCETWIVPELSHAAPLFRAGPAYWHAIADYLQSDVSERSRPVRGAAPERSCT